MQQIKHPQLKVRSSSVSFIQSTNTMCTAALDIPKRQSFGEYVCLHKVATLRGLKLLGRNPLTSLLLLVLMGILIALPAGLFIVLNNLQGLSYSFGNGTQISLFLKTDVTEQQAKELLEQVRNKPGISEVKYISPEEGLQDFKKYSGMNDSLTQLPTNPLPGVLLVQPSTNLDTPIAMGQLVADLKQLPQVDIAQLDLEWIKRLYSMVSTMRTCTIGLAVLFAAVIALLIGNTIAFAIQNERAEMAVVSLAGATQRFMRRAFLYAGAFYGIGSSLIACGIIYTALSWLNKSLQQLAGLYNANFTSLHLMPRFGFFLIGIGLILGLISAWLVVFVRLRSSK